MFERLPQHISCPYCGESLELILDPSEAGLELIEDCQVCCRPINLRFNLDSEGDAQVSVWREDE